MKFLKFIINGGLCGFIDGFDYEKEGHPYNFENLQKTLGGMTKCVDAIKGMAGKLRVNV